MEFVPTGKIVPAAGLKVMVPATDGLEAFSCVSERGVPYEIGAICASQLKEEDTDACVTVRVPVE
jgi:hypothetical protein